MQIKTGILSTLMVLCVITLVGCTTTYLDMKGWKGRTINELYWDWGKADKVEDLNVYERVYTYYIERTVNGQVKTCTKSFYTRSNGYDEVIIDTSYSDCLFFILK